MVVQAIIILDIFYSGAIFIAKALFAAAFVSAAISAIDKVGIIGFLAYLGFFIGIIAMDQKKQ
jgi:hypothetical protein